MATTSVLYQRIATREVKVGNLLIGNYQPIRVQTMTTTDTMDTAATVAQTIRCIEAGAELVRITAPNKTEAENLGIIKKLVREAGFETPLVADIHFTPNAAEIAARLIEKVRVNPGNYVDKKKFDQINYTDAEYLGEIERIRERFTPLVKICKEHGTAMRIGTNHGSLSDRIMSRYGDTHTGMVESAMEFLRIARSEEYHQIILSMKSSNPIVMVQAYRLLVQQMQQEFGECYPLHLGVTEAGDGEDGRIKSAIGIGTLLEEGIGDTIRVSLTEDPEFEIPVCKDLVAKYAAATERIETKKEIFSKDNNIGQYLKRGSQKVGNIGDAQHPVVVADFADLPIVKVEDLSDVGYSYNSITDKWSIADAAADYLFLNEKILDFPLPGTVRPIVAGEFWAVLTPAEKEIYLPIWNLANYGSATEKHTQQNFITIDAGEALGKEKDFHQFLASVAADKTLVFCITAYNMPYQLASLRKVFAVLQTANCNAPVILSASSTKTTIDKQLIDFSIAAGGLLIDGLGDGIWLLNEAEKLDNNKVTGRTYLPINSNRQFLNNCSFSILQASRTRISKTEYISCPSCGRTLFDLQETTAKIRAVTNHLKGLKIAIMGCIVNGPGEMADADFGYVGSGPGKITLYKGKEVMKKNVPSETAVEELILLLKENDAWMENIGHGL